MAKSRNDLILFKGLSFEKKLIYIAPFKEHYLFARTCLEYSHKDSERFAEMLSYVEAIEFNERGYSRVDFMIMDAFGQDYFDGWWDYHNWGGRGLTERKVRSIRRYENSLSKSKRRQSLHYRDTGYFLSLGYFDKHHIPRYHDEWGAYADYNVNSLRQPQMWDGHRIIRKSEAY